MDLSEKDKLAQTVRIGSKVYPLSAVPPPLTLRQDLGLLVHPAVDGQVVHVNPTGWLFETRACITPKGDYLLMFPDRLATAPPEANGHYGSTKPKVNDLVAYRSSDRGKSWQGPTKPIHADYNLHGFIPLIPHGSSRLYCFGTQPMPGHFNGIENSAIGYRYSDDDGLNWSGVQLIEPLNDPGFEGMSVMRMTQTPSGTWLLGTHTGGKWFPLGDGTYTTWSRAYVLRSADQGRSWTLCPGPRETGWYLPTYDRMDEPRPISVGGSEVLMQFRTSEGHLWQSRSCDDGKTWEAPAPTTLIHSDAPPMLFHLSDGKTLIAFHHNSFTGVHFSHGSMRDRGQLWFSTSTDGGRNWSQPRFVLANAFAETWANPWKDQQCSYIDMFTDQGLLHIFMPHRWQRALHLWIREGDLEKFPVDFGT
ncbi:MAG: sialidase family protein [Planctomycetota bacterium]